MFYKIINKKKRFITLVADTLGWFFLGAFVLLGRYKEIKPKEVKSILLIRTAYIGDVIMTIPMVRPLRHRFPEARISFLTTKLAVDLLRGNPEIEEVLTYEPFWFYPSEPKRGYLAYLKAIRHRSFDLVIETRADIREILMLILPLKAKYKVSYGVGGGGYMLSHQVPYPGLKHKVDYHLDICRYLGCPVEDGPVEWGVHFTADENREVEKVLAENGIEGHFLAVHPGSRLVLKRWFNDRYAQLFDQMMTTMGIPLVLLGAPSEEHLIMDVVSRMKQIPINLSGRLSLRQMAGVLSRASVFVCNDSAPMHVAASVSTPTVALFGPSKSVETAPYGLMHLVVEQDMPCRPACDESHCNAPTHHACMHAISVDQAMSAVLELSKKAGLVRRV